MDMQCLKLLRQADFPKQFDMHKYQYSSNECVLEVNLGYPKELMELNNDYPMTPGKIEIIKVMFSGYQLKIADL